jgi:hypothetical protein
LLAACACALALASPLAGAQLDGLTRAQQIRIRSLAAHAPPQGRRVLRTIAPRLAIGAGRQDELAGGDVTFTELGRDGSVTFSVRLGPRTLAPGRYGRHMIMHELGHAVDSALLTFDRRAAFDFAFAHSGRWQQCFAMPFNLNNTRCVPQAEIFADQFAFYATADRRARSGYNVPPLLRRAHFDRLLAQAQPTPDSLLGATPG